MLAKLVDKGIWYFGIATTMFKCHAACVIVALGRSFIYYYLWKKNVTLTSRLNA